MVLSARQVSLAYNHKSVIDQIDFNLQPGQYSLLTGASGVGKSTLLKALAGLYPQYGGRVSGQIELDGQVITKLPANERAQMVAMLFQRPTEQFVMPTVRTELIFALENIQLDRTTIDERIAWSLEKVGMTAFVNRDITSLSGGELQKIALAETLALGAHYLLLDEPFAAVDSQTRAELQQLLAALAREGYAILVTDHDTTGYLDKITTFYHIDDQQCRALPVNQLQSLQHVPIMRPVPLGSTAPLQYQLDKVNVSNGDHSIFTNQSLTIPQSAITLLTGSNGAGKSTLLKTLAKLHDYQGSITYAGKELASIKAKAYYQAVGLVFQIARDQFLTITVAEELAQVIRHTHQPAYWQPKRVQKYLHVLELADYQDQSVYLLSGGQQKKLQIFLMLIMAPTVLLLDEPLAGLDQASARLVVAMLRTIQHDLAMTVVIVSHQVRPLLDVVDYHLCLAAGQLTWIGEVRA